MEEQAILDQLTANHQAALYKCRWSPEDVDVVVPKLVSLLASKDTLIVDEALRALFTIGTPAVDAANDIIPLIESTSTITRKLAVMTLGQVVHQKPEVCVGPMIAVLEDDECRRDALRILAFIGRPAIESLPMVIEQYAHSDAKVRKAAVVAAVSIDPQDPTVTEVLDRAMKDRSKVVRAAALKLTKTQNT